tara:strand:+ start:2098 stop:3276 length:1179 start_codon:yes stop_codon:yes gene_type:complete
LVRFEGLDGLVVRTDRVNTVIGPPYDQVQPGDFLSWLSDSGRINNVTNASSIAEAKAEWAVHRAQNFERIQKPSYFIIEQRSPRFGDVPGGTRYSVMGAVPTDVDVILRNERIFENKKQGRIELNKALGVELGPVLLYTPGDLTSVLKHIRDLKVSQGFQQTLEFTTNFGSFAWSDLHNTDVIVYQVDANSPHGRLISRKALEPHNLYVADGNHRSSAAIEMGLDSFLGVVTDDLTILPYNRLIKSDVPIEEILHGFNYKKIDSFGKPEKGTFQVYTRQGTYVVDIDNSGIEDPANKLDCAVLEGMIYNRLGLTPDSMQDQSIFNYKPGTRLNDMKALVDAEVYDIAISLHEVSNEELMAVSHSVLTGGNPMPQKATYVVPKFPTGIIAKRI